MIEDEKKSIVPSLRNDPLFKEFFFSDLTEALRKLDAKVATEPSAVSEFILSYTQIIIQQAHPFAKELLHVLQRPFSETMDDYLPLTASDIHELLLFACIWLHLPRLFNAIFIRLERMDNPIILEFYVAALRCQQYEVLATLQQIPPPANLIQFALSINCPESHIRFLWDLLDVNSRRSTLITLLSNPSTNLPQFIEDFYDQHHATLFDEDLEIAEFKDSKANSIPHELLVSIKKPSLIQINKLLKKKRFNQIYLSFNIAAKADYLYQIVLDHCLSVEEDKEKDKIDIYRNVFFLQIVLDISPLQMVDYFLRQQQQYHTSSSVLKFLSFATNSVYDLVSLYLVDLFIRNKEITLGPLRMILHQAPQNQNVGAKLHSLIQTNLIVSEMQQLMLRTKKMNFTKDEQLAFKLLFSPNILLRNFTSEIDGILSKDIWQLIGEYLAPDSNETEDDNNWYCQFLQSFPVVNPLSLTRAQKISLRSHINQIDLFLNKIAELKQPLSCRKRFLSIEGVAWSSIILSGLGFLAYSIVFRHIRKNISNQRLAILNGANWTETDCLGRGYSIVDLSVKTAPPLVRSYCDKPSAENVLAICDLLCNQFNSFSINSDIGWEVGVLLALMFLCLACCIKAVHRWEDNTVFSPTVFDEVKGQIGTFYDQKLNRAAPTHPRISEVVLELKNTQAVLESQLTALDNKGTTTGPELLSSNPFRLRSGYSYNTYVRLPDEKGNIQFD